MGPEKDLPLPPDYHDEEKYVQDLLHFVNSCELFRTLVGGVHVLDFFVNEPDLYERIIDADWRAWFAEHETDDLIDFFLRDDLDGVATSRTSERRSGEEKKEQAPSSLIDYISRIRSLTLRRDPPSREDSSKQQEPLPRHLTLGQSSKKTHEVSHLTYLLQTLITDLKSTLSTEITHIIDFGAGQGYLGRFLASPPYNRHVVAVEGRPHNVKGAQSLDVGARLRPKDSIWRNKKVYRAGLGDGEVDGSGDGSDGVVSASGESEQPQKGERPPRKRPVAPIDGDENESGSVWHVERQLESGDLSDVVRDLRAAGEAGISNGDSHQPASDPNNTPPFQTETPRLLVTSLHSCGNLTHHALRSLTLNPSVRAVAIVGCCYNLTTSRLPPVDPPPYDQSSSPEEAEPNPQTSRSAHSDPHGFPMSTRLLTYPSNFPNQTSGIHLSTTSRMLAVQAPHNWGPSGSRAFFTRHFYRALLQRVFLDHGVIDPPARYPAHAQTGRTPANCSIGAGGAGGEGSAAGSGPTQTKPIIIGSLGRTPYASFPSYFRAALAKLELYALQPASFYTTMNAVSDATLAEYEEEYAKRKKELSVVWTLMAFSAQLVEAVVVVDRWAWLREQIVEGGEGGMEGGRAWVVPVWEYGVSPRNLVVVGIKG